MSKKSVAVKTKRESRYLRYNFTDPELLAKGKELGEATQANQRLDEELQQVKSQFKFKIDEKLALIGKLTSNVTTGYEMRNVPCIVELHKPKTGKKTVTRADIQEVVGVEDMTQEESQEAFDFANMTEDDRRRLETDLNDSLRGKGITEADAHITVK